MAQRTVLKRTERRLGGCGKVFITMYPVKTLRIKSKVATTRMKSKKESIILKGNKEELLMTERKTRKPTPRRPRKYTIMRNFFPKKN